MATSGCSESPIAVSDKEILSLELAPKTFRFSWTDVDGASYYRLLEDPDSLSGYTPISGDIPSGTTSFELEVALYKRVNARYILESCTVEDRCIETSALNVSGTLEDAIVYIKASNSGRNDVFGEDISLSGDGNTLAVGARLESSSSSGINSTPDDLSDSTGAVYIFVRNGRTWSEQAYIKASNSGPNDTFGSSVSLSDDGNTLAVGASLEDSSTSGINSTPDDLGASTGAVYIFIRNGSIWSEQAYIKASNTGNIDLFGEDTSLSGDGNTLAVGALREDSSTNGINSTPDDLGDDTGAVYIFVRNGSTWSEQAYIKTSDSDRDESFGSAISLSDDGDTLAVGTTGKNSSTSGIITPDEPGDGTGAVYVFVRNGSTWSEQAIIKASNSGRSDSFGIAVSLSDDGDTLAVGAISEDSSTSGINSMPDDLGDNTGAVYIFVRSGITWSEQAFIKASNSGNTDYFGDDVSLSNDGNTLAVGATGEDSTSRGINSRPDDRGNGNGATYVFSRSGGIWRQTAYIKNRENDNGDKLGISVSISDDANTLAVGASGEDSSTSGVNTLPNDLGRLNGAAYLY